MKQAACHPDRPHEAKGLCKACASAAWRAVNKERLTLQRVRRQEYHRAWYAAHKEEQNLQHRAWMKANPERQCALNRLRRARKLGAIGAITSDQWVSIKASYAWRCAYCGKKPASLTQDHVIPLSRGGSHIPANIVPACRSCNARKGARPPTRLPARRLLI